MAARQSSSARGPRRDGSGEAVGNAGASSRRMTGAALEAPRCTHHGAAT
jgi:hypothetical protein